MPFKHINWSTRIFSRAFRGYAPQEVDKTLQDMSDKINSLCEEKLALVERVTQLERENILYRQREQALREALTAGKRLAEEMKLSARQEAHMLLQNAKNQADTMMADGIMRLARLKDEILRARKAKTLFSIKMRTLLESHKQLLDMDEQEEQKAQKPQAQKKTSQV